MALSLSWDQVIHAKPLFGAFYCVLNIVNIIERESVTAEVLRRK